jgi:signal transduction histidine kinase
MNIFKALIFPKSNNEESARKEFILNILLFSCVVIIGSALLLHISQILFHFLSPETYQNDSLNIEILIALLIFLIVLYRFSVRGYFKFSSAALLIALYAITAYMCFKWGVDLPVSILFFSLIIVMSGILINSGFSFTITSLIVVTIMALNHLQRNNIIETNDYWRAETWTISNALMASIIFLVIALISWLSNKEMEKSLERAKKSELELKKERDSLEIKVEERTKEIQRLEAEKMIQFYKFAEYGKLAAGIFHDIINPLTAASLNIEKIRSDTISNKELKLIESDIDKAKYAIDKIGKLIDITRKQTSNQKDIKEFCLNKEIEDSIKILSYKINKNFIKILFNPEKDFFIKGNPIRFNQVITNLISNAIDAYINASKNKRIIKISLLERNNRIRISVADHGLGIPDEIKDKIFTMFSTKEFDRGTGVGLYLVKNILEKEFNGKIRFKTKEDKGTIFIAIIPQES